MTYARQMVCVLQCVAVGSKLQCIAAGCSVLQCVSECCSKLQVCAAILSFHKEFALHSCDAVKSQLYFHVMQCVAVCCSVLQCVAVCCSVSQYVAVCAAILSFHKESAVHPCDAVKSRLTRTFMRMQFARYIHVTIERCRVDANIQR